MNRYSKKCAELFALIALLVCAVGCGAQTGGPSAAETPAPLETEEPSPALLQAAQYASLEGTRLLAEKEDPPGALAYEGKPEHVMLVEPGGVIDDLILQQFQDGQTLAEAAECGVAEAVVENGRILWEGEAYSCLHVTLEDAVIPGFISDSGGILWLEISGDCALDTGGAEYDCFSGFSSVYITGSGTLTLSGGEGGINCGGGELPLPALVIDGPQLVAGFMQLAENGEGSDTVPSLLLADGGLSAHQLTLPQSGALCVTGGTLKLELLIERGGSSAIVFRGGRTEIEQIAFLDGTAALTVTGGEVTLGEDTISTESVVVSGGSLTAPQIGEKQGLVLLGGEAMSPAVDRPYDQSSPDQWLEQGDLARVQIRQQEISICDAAQVSWTVAAQGDLAPMHAWGGLALELADDAAIQSGTGDSALGATALRLSGTGTLTLSGAGTGIGMWAWGDMPAPYFELCDSAALVIECAGESLSMGSESGGRGLALFSGGSLTADHDLWLQNSDMAVSGGAVITKAALALEAGDLTLSSGSLEADNLYLGNGNLIVTGGVLDLGAGGLDVRGDIRITGGLVRLPGGQGALNATGNVIIDGGAVEDSSKAE